MDVQLNINRLLTRFLSGRHFRKLKETKALGIKKLEKKCICIFYS